ncbi:MAG TPA: YetF domain-containing protein [Flavipsychrobacter sp.]|nr:YetF domain-containing protein [Flavipsychrobacter sp.]
MNKEEIFFGDWERMFIGEVPGAFYLELGFRTLFVYLLLITSMRLMGKRMSAQLSRNEMAALFTFAAAIGVPLQDPARGILPALIIASIVTIVGSAVARLSFRHPGFEKVSQGEMDILVKDGEVLPKTLRNVRITRNRLFAQLRSEGVKHLGEVKRLYMEAGGAFTLIKNDDPQPGLSIIPEWDTELTNEQKATQIKLCADCGAKQSSSMSTERPRCKNCKKNTWTNAIEAA